MRTQIHSQWMRAGAATVVVLIAVTLPAGLTPPAAGESTSSAGALAQAFPLWVQFDYRKESSVVKVKGTTLPGAVVQARGASVVVSPSGSYALKTTFPLSLVAVRGRLIRRVGFDLPAKAKRYVAVLAVGTDLKRMWASISGSLTITEHPAASIVVRHVQAGTTHRGTLTKGSFLVGLPLVQQTNTLQWWLQIGPARWQGPDLTVVVQ